MWYLSDIRSMVVMEDILIINWPKICGSHRFDMKESKLVEIVGLNDKHLITALLTCTMSGKFLPIRDEAA